MFSPLETGWANGRPFKYDTSESVVLTVLLSGAAMSGTTSAEIGIRSPVDVLRLMITLSKRRRTGCVEPNKVKLMCSEL